MKKLKVVTIFLFTFIFLGGCTLSGNITAKRTTAPVLDRILERGELIVGTAASMPPLNMTTKEGDIIGFEPDIANAIADAMGVRLNLKAIPFPDLLTSLEAGNIDMVISGMSITAQRNLEVAFVGPYFVSGKGFLTKVKTIAARKDNDEINRPEVKLAALENSTSQLFVETVLFNTTLVLVSDYDEAVDMVIRDEVHALVADHPICRVSVARYPDKGLLSVLTPLTYEPLGIALPGNDPHLVNWLENFLNSLKGSGALDNLKERWTKNTSWLNQLP